MDLTPEKVFALLKSTEEFPVNFDDAWEWIGYSRKDAAKFSFQKSEFIEGIDFQIFQNSMENSKIGRPSSKWMLTIDCFKSFAMVSGTPKGKEVRRYFINCENQLKELLQGRKFFQWTNPDQEWAYHQQRYDIRIYLKDTLRPELMNLVVRWAESHGQSPITLCSEVHDAMNLGIQGARSSQISQQGGIPLGHLVRDYYGTVPLLNYCGINRLAINAMQDEGMHPVDAVYEACRRYLSRSYQPKLVPIIEPVHQERKRLKEERKRRALAAPNQLSLFSMF